MSSRPLVLLTTVALSWLVCYVIVRLSIALIHTLAPAFGVGA